MGDEGERAFERSRPLNRSLTQRDAFVSFSSSLTEGEREREQSSSTRNGFVKVLPFRGEL